MAMLYFAIHLRYKPDVFIVTALKMFHCWSEHHIHAGSPTFRLISQCDMLVNISDAKMLVTLKENNRQRIVLTLFIAMVGNCIE